VLLHLVVGFAGPASLATLALTRLRFLIGTLGAFIADLGVAFLAIAGFVLLRFVPALVRSAFFRSFGGFFTRGSLLARFAGLLVACRFVAV
jgi:hypothetical protein